jgi:zinc/manganese transport system substrate-binding protein
MNRAPSRMAGVLATLALSAVSALSLGACSSSSDPNAGNNLPTAAAAERTGHETISVVAAENVWGNIAYQIGRDKVEVTSIINDPSVDPHEYETSPRNAAAVSTADLVIANGVGYDSFVDKLLKASPNGRRDVLKIENAVKLSGDNPNPHLWYDPTYVVDGARAIEAELAKQMPAAGPEFETNLRTFLVGEHRVVDVIDTIEAKYEGTKVAYTERVPGYLTMAAGLQLGTPESFAQSIEDGNDPTPGDSAIFQAALARHEVKVLIYNAQVSTSTTQKLRQLAMHNKVPVVGVTETMPSDTTDFQSWQADQAKALLAALGG